MRVLITLLIILIFALIIFLSLDIQSDHQELENRIVLVSDVENSKQVTSIFPNAAGDYLVGYNYKDNLYNAMQINSYLTLLDDNFYDYAKNIKNDDYKKYIKDIDNTFGVKINEYFRFLENDKVDTNIDDSAKIYYQHSKNQIQKLYTSIKKDISMYDPEDNNQWLRIAEQFNYETNGEMDKSINTTLINKLTKYSTKNLNKGMFLSFVNVYNPMLDCSDDICKYSEDSYKDMETNFNAKSEKKILYNIDKIDSFQFEGTPLTKTDQEEISKINQENYATKGEFEKVE